MKKKKEEDLYFFKKSMSQETNAEELICIKGD